MKKKTYEKELLRLQAELVVLQAWVRAEGKRVIVVFGVEWVMGLCTATEQKTFLHQCPIFERLPVEDGVILRKYWFSVIDEEQEFRIRSRVADPMRQKRCRCAGALWNRSRPSWKYPGPEDVRVAVG